VFISWFKFKRRWTPYFSNYRQVNSTLKEINNSKMMSPKLSHRICHQESALTMVQLVYRQESPL